MMVEFPKSKVRAATGAQAYIEPNNQSHGTVRLEVGGSVEHFRLPIAVFSLLGVEIQRAMRELELKLSFSLRPKIKNNSYLGISCCYRHSFSFRLGQSSRQRGIVANTIGAGLPPRRSIIR